MLWQPGLASIITDLLLIVFYKKSNDYFNLKHLIIETFKIIISCLGFILLWWIINNVIKEVQILLMYLSGEYGLLEGAYYIS